MEKDLAVWARDIIIPKTDEEKRQLIDGALWKLDIRYAWSYKGLCQSMGCGKTNRCLTGPDPTKLKTGIGKTDMAADEFYWQDYLGKDYAVRAIQLARQYGNPDDLFLSMITDRKALTRENALD